MIRGRFGSGAWHSSHICLCTPVIMHCFTWGYIPNALTAVYRVFTFIYLNDLSESIKNDKRMKKKMNADQCMCVSVIH